MIKVSDIINGASKIPVVGCIFNEWPAVVNCYVGKWVAHMYLTLPQFSVKVYFPNILLNFIETNSSMALVISDEEIKRSGLSEQQFKLEIALHLYAMNVFTLGQAAAS